MFILMALYPRQNSNFCLQHCCFELSLDFTLQYSTSTIQHCPFTIQCPYFKCNVVRTCDILIQCSMCLYGVKCDMLAMQSNILVSCILNQYPYFASKFLRLTCDIRVFQCNVDTRCVCCGAECDMPATQSNILLHARVNNHSHTRSQGPLIGVCQDGGFQTSVRHRPAHHRNSKQFRDDVV